MPALPSPRPLAVVLAALALSACANGLPDPDVIEYTRVLAMQVTFPDDGDTPATRAEGLPLETATITPWIADPSGPLSPARIRDDIQPTWFACTLRPGQGVGGCLLGARPIDPATIPDCPVPTPADLDPNAPPEPPPSPCRLTEGPPEAPQLTLPLDPLFLLGSDMEVTLIGSSDPTVSTDDCARALLDSTDTPPLACLFASQRVAVGPDSTLRALAADLGFPSEGPPPPDPPAEPNRNPLLESVQVRVIRDGVAGTAIPVFAGDLLQVPAMDTALEITANLDETSEQSYLIERTVDGATEYQAEQEDLTGDWANNWGYIEYGDSQGLSHLNIWTLMPAAGQDLLGPGDTAHMFLVLRDNRSGTTWFDFGVLLQ